jgi:hypothetical protein
VGFSFVVDMTRSLSRASRKLLKTALWAGRFYPVPGYEAVRKTVREEFNRVKELERSTVGGLSDEQIKESIARGRWMLKELEALNKLHKYRQMKKRYYDE